MSIIMDPAALERLETDMIELCDLTTGEGRFLRDVNILAAKSMTERVNAGEDSSEVMASISTEFVKMAVLMSIGVFVQAPSCVEVLVDALRLEARIAIEEFRRQAAERQSA